MKEEPVFSSGAFKVLVVLVFAAALGVGGYLIAGGGGINLPDLPEIETTTGEVNLQDTTLEDTTIDGPEDIPVPTFPTDPDQALAQAEKLNRCVEEAGNDPEKIFACLEKFE